jgi:hypothetical protein
MKVLYSIIFSISIIFLLLLLYLERIRVYFNIKIRWYECHLVVNECALYPIPQVWRHIIIIIISLYIVIVPPSKKFLKYALERIGILVFHEMADINR